MRLILRYWSVPVYGGILQLLLRCHGGPFWVVAFCPPQIPQRRISYTPCLFAKSSTSDDDSTMSTALCVVPPGPSWDMIQRARHVARDRTYHKWPPSIRLFHPFCPNPSDYALELAKVVEKYNIKPFEISLNEWVIIPHMEALERELDALQQLPDQETVVQEEEKSEDELLIEREERIGRQRIREKWRKQKLKQQNNGSQQQKGVTAAMKKQHVQHEDSSRRALLEKQRRMYEEFNGPCVVCLEPDAASRAKLMKLRQILKRELFSRYENYSPTSSADSTEPNLPRSALEEKVFRPVLPIGQFPTVTSAIETARKLKGLWEPLTFEVTDLHMVSIHGHVVGSDEGDKETNQEEQHDFNREYDLTTKMKQQQDKEIVSEGQFGCDAMVMLMGQEVEMNEEENKMMAEKVMREGIPGGSDPENTLSTSSMDPNHEDTSNLEGWLDSDDEWDEGTVLVMGRTHFFTGEMRMYVGMPASSSMDAKDRVLGGGGVDGATRRRGAENRGAIPWKDGDYGIRRKKK